MPHAVRRSLAAARAQSERMRGIVARGAASLASTPVAGSQWSVAEHVDHTLKTANSILRLLIKPSMPAQPRGINLIGRLVLLFGWIPRGRGNSPERLRGALASDEELRAQIEELDDLLKRLSAGDEVRAEVPIIRHPLFGALTFTQALRFIVVHTRHHLKIVEDAGFSRVSRPS